METTEDFCRCAENCVPDACKYGRGESCAMWHDPRMEAKRPMTDKSEGVVWEWKGTRVKQDGTLEFWVDGWGPAKDGWVSTGAAKAMAKALAESMQARAQTP